MQVAQQTETDKKLKELSKVKKEVEVLRWVTKGGAEGQRCAASARDVGWLLIFDGRHRDFAAPVLFRSISLALRIFHFAY